MDIQQLRYIVSLSQELHFQRAAKRVNVTQPTLSQGIKKLEDELGVHLFERSPQYVALTEAGKTFIPNAISVLDQLEKSVHELKEKGGEISGVVRVGVIPTICPYLMPEVLSMLRKKAPKIVMEIHEETTSMVLEHLKTGGLDIGILALPITERGISCLSICNEPFYLAVPSKHKFASKRRVTAKDISKEQILILQEGHCFSDQSLEYCKLQRQHPQIVFQGSSLTSVLKLAAAGEGITFIPRMAIEKPARGVRFVTLSSPEPTRELGVIWRLTSPLSRAQNVLIGVVEKALQKIVRSRPST